MWGDSAAYTAVVPGKRSADPGPITTGRSLAKIRSCQPATNHSLGLWSRIGARLRARLSGTTAECGSLTAHVIPQPVHVGN
ncbi:hypothetical protein GA0061098_100846 [Bradyrhizobium shewense]|uniref:Uncharacterized protein n=1 Tax=Bradyrhizobium shewense TaxID=1761772 RepID=A0A1C3WII2_9BRAD|nr:hypothetical protein GA0061098_100846 [Bradyrhizobium shewense]